MLKLYEVTLMLHPVTDNREIDEILDKLDETKPIKVTDEPRRIRMVYPIKYKQKEIKYAKQVCLLMYMLENERKELTKILSKNDKVLRYLIVSMDDEIAEQLFQEAKTWEKTRVPKPKAPIIGYGPELSINEVINSAPF